MFYETYIKKCIVFVVTGPFPFCLTAFPLFQKTYPPSCLLMHRVCASPSRAIFEVSSRHRKRAQQIPQSLTLAPIMKKKAPGPFGFFGRLRLSNIGAFFGGWGGVFVVCGEERKEERGKRKEERKEKWC